MFHPLAEKFRVDHAALSTRNLSGRNLKTADRPQKVWSKTGKPPRGRLPMPGADPRANAYSCAVARAPQGDYFFSAGGVTIVVFSTFFSAGGFTIVVLSP